MGERRLEILKWFRLVALGGGTNCTSLTRSLLSMWKLKIYQEIFLSNNQYLFTSVSTGEEVVRV